MKYLLTSVLFAVCITLFISVQMAHAEGQQKKVIVTFDEEIFTTEASQRALASRFGGQVKLSLPFMNAVAVSLPSQASVKALSQVRGVTGIYEDVEMSLVKKPVSVGPNPAPEPSVENVDWGVKQIQADSVWAKERGDTVKVAVLDTGIDADHPDLADNVRGGIGYILGEKWYSDRNGHGTHVAGTIASVDNEVGYVGVAPETEIYAVQVLNRRGSGDLSYLLAGLDWAIQTNKDDDTENDIDVITMSLGFDSKTITSIDQLFGLKERLDEAETVGIVVVCAAGNDGLNTVSYPAKYPSIIAVAATADTNDNVADYSNWGVDVDVAAPGSSITSTWKDGGYKTISGTSMATPHVTGVVALVLGQGTTVDSNGNNRINDEVFKKIVDASTLQTVSGPNTYNFGRIDALRALAI